MAAKGGGGEGDQTHNVRVGVRVLGRVLVCVPAMFVSVPAFGEL